MIDKITEILYQNEITEKSLYFSRAKQAMEDYGKFKWKEAQESAAQRSIKFKNKHGQSPVYSKTPFKK